jgi:hypothetical protein
MFPSLFVIDIWTLTNDMKLLLMFSPTQIFCGSRYVWLEHTGDRMWPFQVWDYYKEKVTAFMYVDSKNVGFEKGCGAC